MVTISDNSYSDFDDDFDVNNAIHVERIHGTIAEIYRWWAEHSPGVTPKEEGPLKLLWAEHDRLSGMQN